MKIHLAIKYEGSTEIGLRFCLQQQWTAILVILESGRLSVQSAFTCASIKLVSFSVILLRTNGNRYESHAGTAGCQLSGQTLRHQDDRANLALKMKTYSNFSIVFVKWTTESSITGISGDIHVELQLESARNK